MEYLHVFQAEWLKSRRTLASWLVIIGAGLTPLIILIARLALPKTLPEIYQHPKFWQNHWMNSWESMAFMMIPLGVTLAASLLTQLEFRNNTWKQWHTTPHHWVVLYTGKYAMMMLMLLQFIVLFLALVIATAYLPPLYHGKVHQPKADIPWAFFGRQSLHYFTHTLPIISLQFLIGLLFRNFLVSIGAGIVCWICAVATLTWKWAFLLPYSHTSLYFLKTSGRIPSGRDLTAWSLGYFLTFTIAGYILYLRRKEKT